MNTTRIVPVPVFRLLFYCFLLNGCASNTNEAWTIAGGSKAGGHYSAATQIDSLNAGQLTVAWQHHTGDADTAAHSQMQCNPIVIDSVVYITSPKLKVMALHAETGKLLWSFDPADSTQGYDALHFILNNNRGLTWYNDGKGKQRILYAAGSNLYCIDAKSGKPAFEFADSGRLDLHTGLPQHAQNLFVTATSPGIIYQNLYITGIRVDEGAAAAPGYIRAFDALTGKLVWTFRTIPMPGEYGHDTWDDPDAWQYTGGANSWAGLTLDEERGILFAPTGSASFDFYGGRRKGANLFANCLLALDAASGKRIWHYQFVHHDLWDWDLPTAPVLATINHQGKKVDVVAQPTKHGMVYVLDRTTGEPVFPIDEIAVDTVSELEGEKVFPTQPIPQLPRPFVRQTITPNEVNPHLPKSNQDSLRSVITGARHGKMFLPPGLSPIIQLPGLDGGAEWGGPALDPESGWLYINANEMAWYQQMRKVDMVFERNETFAAAGKRLYQRHCSSCHGNEKHGGGNYPSLVGIEKKMDGSGIVNLINSGRRMMPAMAYIADEDKAAIAAFVLNDNSRAKETYHTRITGRDSLWQLPYALVGYKKLVAPNGRPGISPPWGTLTAINLNTGEHVWQKPLGQYPELAEKGLPDMGTENYGGPVVTAGGLLIIAGTVDGHLRIFNKWTGELLFKYKLPYASFATPSVYTYKGRQYIVLVCGGGKLDTPAGDVVMAFALPE